MRSAPGKSASGRWNKIGRHMNGTPGKTVLFQHSALSRTFSVVAMLLLVLTGCTSSVDQANKYEAEYDRLMSRGARRAALEAITRSVKNDENEPRRWLKLAKVQDMLNRTTGAAVSYQHALDLQPTNIEALENLAVLSVRGGQFDMAKRYIEPLLLLDPNDLAGLLAASAVAMAEKRFADADKIATTIIAGAPTLEEGYILRARVRELTGHPLEAIKLLEERQAIDPDNRDLPRELLNMYRRRGDIDSIRRTTLKLYAKFPDNPTYAMESVRAYKAMGRTDDARNAIARLSQKYAANVSMMLAIAGLWRDMEPASAVDRIAAMAATSPPRVRASLADLLTSMGAPARAVALMAPSVAQPVSVTNIDAQASYARALYAMGRTAETERKVDAILAFDETNPVALLLRARLELARGDFMKAATDAGVVASDDDANEEAALLVASIYAAQGNPLLAAKAYGDARSKFPDSPRVVDNQTKWLLSQKRVDDAINIAAAYAHVHQGQFDAWRIYRDICTAAQNATCLAEARRAIENF
jgi:tetratricopeptide (TPR) repeat protein